MGNFFANGVNRELDKKYTAQDMESGQYWLKMTYPDDDVFLFKGDIKIGLIKDYYLNKMLPFEELEELGDNGYLNLDDRMGKAFEKFLKTGEFKLKKPLIHMQKFVKESLNERIEEQHPNIQVAEEILSHKDELQEEFDNNVYRAIIKIATAVKHTEDVNDAILNYADTKGWFEATKPDMYKRRYISLIQILEELGFELNDGMMDIINNPDKYMNESINESSPFHRDEDGDDYCPECGEKLDSLGHCDINRCDSEDEMDIVDREYDD